MYYIADLYFIIIVFINILLQFFYFKPHWHVIVTFFFPYELFLKIDNLLLHFINWRHVHLDCVVNLRETIDLEIFLLGSNDL